MWKKFIRKNTLDAARSTYALLKVDVTDTSNHKSVSDAIFSIWKSLQVLQKARIKIVACAIYTYQFFHLHTLFSSAAKQKSCSNRWFLEQIRPQTTIQLYILQDYSSVGIGFNMNSKRHILPMLV